jgi:hypothetical protein
MTTANFSLAHCKSLPFKNAIEYIEQYFIPLDDGTHAYFTNGEWVVRTNEIILNVFFNRLPQILNDYYFREYTRVLTPINDKTKPQFYDDFINFGYKPAELPRHYTFIIDEFINKCKGLNHKPKELYDLYTKYNWGVLITKNEFMDKLSDANIKTMKSGTTMYRISYEELFEIGLKNEWYFRDFRDIEIEQFKKQIAELNTKYKQLADSIEYVDEVVNNDVADNVVDEFDEILVTDGEDTIA